MIPTERLRSAQAGAGFGRILRNESPLAAWCSLITIMTSVTMVTAMTITTVMATIILTAITIIPRASRISRSRSAHRCCVFPPPRVSAPPRSPSP